METSQLGCSTCEEGDIKSFHIDYVAEKSPWSLMSYIRTYFGKFRGKGRRDNHIRTLIDKVTTIATTRDSKLEFFNPSYNSLLSFLAISLIGLCDKYFLSRFGITDDLDVSMIIAAYGASSIIIFDAYHLPIAQPRHVLIAFPLSAIIGVVFNHYTSFEPTVKVSFAVSVTLFTTNFLEIQHPPSGAVAAIAVLGSDTIKALKWGYVLTSTGGALMSVLVAVLFHNIVPGRHYPLWW